MSVIFKTPNAVFKFLIKKEVKELIVRKKSEYDEDEVAKLLELISDEKHESIVIPEEPVYFDRIALDLICAGYGFVLCRTCNKRYSAKQLKSIKVGGDGNPLYFKREKKGVIKSLFTKKRKPPEIFGFAGCTCPADHQLLTVMTFKTF